MIPAKGKSFGCHVAVHVCPRYDSILAKYEAF